MDINGWNNPPTWLKVATASEEPPTPTYLRFFAIFAHGKDEKTQQEVSDIKRDNIKIWIRKLPLVMINFVWSWWRHQMETFSTLLAICAGNSPVPGAFPAQRPVTRSFDVFFDLRLKKKFVNNREASDLRRHRAHYDVIVIYSKSTRLTCLPFG